MYEIESNLFFINMTWQEIVKCLEKKNYAFNLVCFDGTEWGLLNRWALKVAEVANILRIMLLFMSCAVIERSISFWENGRYDEISAEINRFCTVTSKIHWSIES